MHFISLLLAAVLTFAPIATTTVDFVKMDNRDKSITAEVIVEGKGKTSRIAISGVVNNDIDLMKSVLQLGIESKGELFGDFKGDVLLDKGNLYASKELVAGFLQREDTRDSIGLKNAFKLASEEFKGEYLLLYSHEDLKKEISDNEERVVMESLKVLSTALKEAMKDVKLSTGVLTQTNNTLTINLDSKSLLQSTKKVVDYFNSNHKVIDTFVKTLDSEYTKLIDKLENSPLLEEQEVAKDLVEQLDEIMPELGNRIKETMVALKEALDEKGDKSCEPIKNKEQCLEEYGKECEANNCMAEKTLSETFDDLGKSSLNTKITKSKDLYEITSLVKVDIADSEVSTVKFNASIKSVDSFTAKTLTGGEEVEDFIKFADKVFYKANPVDKMLITWVGYNDKIDNYVSVEFDQLNKDKYDVDSTKIMQFFSKDGRTYLPMRTICESFGEEVQWDGEKHMAFVIRDGEKFDMTGIIEDGVTYVKVRDFEKLGYFVDYSNADGKSLATIKKS